MNIKASLNVDGQGTSGFYCKVCDCTLKDSSAYYDHLNGKKHNRNLGISLKKFTDSTLQEVKEMLELKKRQRDGEIVEEEDTDNDEEDDEDEEVDEDAEAANVDSDGEQDEEQDEMAKLMGFSNFSTTKR